MLIGNKIDKNTLAAMPQYPSPTDKDCATQALTQMEDKQKDADNNVNAMKERYGFGVSTMVMIYNASGADLNYLGIEDSSGHLGQWPVDSVIANGQWSVFLHVHTSGSVCGSVAVAKFTSGYGGNVNLSWETPYKGSNSAGQFTDIPQKIAVVSSVGQDSTSKVQFTIKAA